MTTRWTRIAAVAQLELRVQRREPLTMLYMLVFALLAMAFTAAGPIELVRGRGAVPRDAAWSLMLASTAITAFGQVITTMVAATVVLRDRADRVADLLIATRLTEPEYHVAKLLAALVMLSLIYAAIPFGLVMGAVIGGGSLASAVRGTLPPFVAVVFPTMLAIGALQFAAGVLSGRLWVIVGQGLVLIWLWTSAIDPALQHGSAIASLVDPFGSAPLLAATRTWSDAERASRAMPVTGMLLLSRGFWMLIGAAAAGVAVMHRHSRRVAQTRAHSAIVAKPTAGIAALRRSEPPRWVSGMRAAAAYVSRWMLRDAGWRVLALLGAVNVGAHAIGAPAHADPSVTALTVVQEHARLFLILLATIYAGELVWREREERSAALFGALPAPRSAVITGRITGVVVAQAALVALLGLAATLGVVASGSGIPLALPGALVLRVLLPFVAWMLVSLAVHVLVDQKVMAHLLCIAGWAVASVRLGAATATAESRVPPTAWLVVCLLACVIVLTQWHGDGAGRRRDRRPGVSHALV